MKHVGGYSLVHYTMNGKKNKKERGFGLPWNERTAEKTETKWCKEKKAVELFISKRKEGWSGWCIWSHNLLICLLYYFTYLSLIYVKNYSIHLSIMNPTLILYIIKKGKYDKFMKNDYLRHFTFILTLSLFYLFFKEIIKFYIFRSFYICIIYHDLLF